MTETTNQQEVSKPFRVYDFEGDLRATMPYPVDAAHFAGHIGSGATIRQGGETSPVLWTEGIDDSNGDPSTAESVILDRIAGLERIKRARADHKELIKLEKSRLQTPSK